MCSAGYLAVHMYTFVNWQLDSAVAQAGRYRHLTGGARVCTQDVTCLICGGQSGCGRCSSPSPLPSSVSMTRLLLAHIWAVDGQKSP